MQVRESEWLCVCKKGSQTNTFCNKREEIKSSQQINLQELNPATVKAAFHADCLIQINGCTWTTHTRRQAFAGECEDPSRANDERGKVMTERELPDYRDLLNDT